MDILLTNDDGILAPGIAALHRAVSDLGTIHVVAPETGQSAAGHSITLVHPLVCRKLRVADEFTGWSVEGRPVDCVKLAIMELIGVRPKLVLSGINAGGNSGVNVLYSGTVAAAVEGAMLGIPSIAFSLDTERDYDFDRAARTARMVLDRVLAGGLYPGMLLNVNIPQRLDGLPPRGIRIVRQAVNAWEDSFERRTDPRGRTYFWLGAGSRKPGPPETDDHALDQGFVAITPLHFDLTHTEQMKSLAARDWGPDTPTAPKS